MWTGAAGQTLTRPTPGWSRQKSHSPHARLRSPRPLPPWAHWYNAASPACRHPAAPLPPCQLAGEGHWFWRVIAHFRAYYVEAAVSAILINILALASIFFTMNVYDRVVNNQAYTTLWTLAIGVGIALVFEYFLRNLRAWLLDSAGKKADLLLGSSLFAKVQATRLEARPQSAGAFANMLKEYESLRDFATSTVLVALSDLPFLLMFLAVLYVIAGRR